LRSFGLAKGSAKSLHFLAKYVLSPYLRSANWLSESLSQKVKSPSVVCEVSTGVCTLCTCYVYSEDSSLPLNGDEFNS